MSVSEAARRPRGFVLDRESGEPIEGALVFAVAEFDDRRRLPVGTLASDVAGYVSFDLRALGGRAVNNLWVEVLGDDENKASLVENGEANGGPFHLLVDASTVVTNGGEARLPAVQSPDTADWEISPASFAVRKDLVLDEGKCQVPVPATPANSQFRFLQVVRRSASSRDPDSGARVAARRFLGLSESSADGALEALNVSVGPDQDERYPVALGEVLSFKQSWSPLGHSLGDIVYSLPLAPCESVDVAVIDWSRTDRAQRQDSVVGREQLLHSQRRDRVIEEAVSGALEESQGGWSLQAGIGAARGGSAAATAPVGGVPVEPSGGSSLVAGIAGGVAQSWGERDLTADSLQELHDSVLQASSVVRSLNSTVVIQASAQEHNYVETRTVTNNNHCHALTVQYYEVLRHFRVDTEYAGRQKAILMPYQLVDFTWEIALRHRTVLERVLLDRELLACFDAIVRSRLCPGTYPGGQPSGGGTSSASAGDTPQRAPTITRYELTLTTGERETWGKVRVELGLSDGRWVQLYDKPRKEDGGAELFKDTDHVVDIQSGAATGIDPHQVERVKVSWYEAGGNDAWSFKGVRIRYARSDRSGLTETLIDESKNPELVRFDDSWGEWKDWHGQATAPAAPTPAPTPGPMPVEPSEPTEPDAPTGPSKVEDQCCETKLLVHLNANKGYYSRAVWVLQDPTERAMLLDAALGTTSRLREAIDPVPLAVSGNYVAFPFRDGTSDSNGEGSDLLAELRPRTSIVSMPSRGLFAETHLSHCGACEERDVTRFWDWSESPCPEPPEIQGVTPGPRGQTASPQSPSLPAPIVQLMNAPEAPDPVGLAAALGLLGKSDVFRDMSGMKEVSKLLDGLVSGAVTLAQAKDMAGNAKDALGTALAEGGGKGNGGSAAARSATEQVDYVRAAQHLAKLAPEIGLEEGTVRDIATAWLGGQALAEQVIPDAGTQSDGAVAFESLAVFELGSSADSKAFTQEMAKHGVWNVTPPADANYTGSPTPLSQWAAFPKKKPPAWWWERLLAQAPEWFYLSGHMLSGLFSNEGSMSEDGFWSAEFETPTDANNPFWKAAHSAAGVPYRLDDRCQVVLVVGCATIEPASESMETENIQEVFSEAGRKPVILGFHRVSPSGTDSKTLVVKFVQELAKDWDSRFELQHLAGSWLAAGKAWNHQRKRNIAYMDGEGNRFKVRDSGAYEWVSLN
jgi:hypothetical protein